VTFSEAKEFLYSFVDWEKTGGRPTDPGDLVRFRAFLKALGDPQEHYDIVHVVGTNGKGSASAMLASILAAGGRRVGLYTSPHLVSVRERIQVNGVPITEFDFAAGMERLKSLAGEVSLVRGGYRTTFELLTALALLHFQQREVTIAVVEAGLGGRLDATVALKPKLSMVTPIHLDHTETLGNTLYEIARDKTAVIRSGIPLVTAAQPVEVRRVLARVVAERHPSRWVRLGHEVIYRSWRADDGYRGARYAVGDRHVEIERLPLRGRHQVANAAMALGGALTLDPELPVSAARAGLAATRWPGRLETITGTPLLLLEGAHNPHAARALAAFLNEWEESNRRPATLLVAISKGKDVNGILRPLLATTSTLVACSPVPARSIEAGEVARRATLLGFNAVAEPNPQRALRLAEGPVGNAGLVIVCGSLYLVGSVAEIRAVERTWWASDGGLA
jgi:dihydrofolate synthase/folylpolyglutamate synthase